MHVCLIAEGSYPYVTGGVGKWTHDLIASIPEAEFTVVALWPGPGSHGEPKYPRLPNVREVRHVWLFSGLMSKKPVPPEAYARLETFHRRLKEGDPSGFKDALGCAHGGAFLKDPLAWELLGRLYETDAPPGTSLADYYWTFRATHEPLFRVLGAELPKADVLHTISTGYAGLLGAAQRQRTGTPLLTTEHGLYTKERAHELWDAEWIPGEIRSQLRREPNFFRDWWRRMFEGMERITYAGSDLLITLFEENRRYQIARGAPPERTRVIPNGVDLRVFDEVRRRRAGNGHVEVGLVGRVVPIKDVKTFIEAGRAVVSRLGRDRVRLSVVGPTEEDEIYAAQCREMAALAGLDGCLSFTGRVDARKYYEKLDVMVLTSLSEGQPLAVLEALACGIPVVAPDVGSCRELLEGRAGADADTGPAGIVTLPVDAAQTADAVVRLAEDAALRKAMGDAGRRRVEQSYRLEQVGRSYLDVYQEVSRGRR